METARLIQPGFSSADAKEPEINLKGEVLTMRFKEWNGHSVEVLFSDVLAFRWQTAESFCA